MKKISILVPCYNEEAVLDEFYLRVEKVISKIDKYAFEYVFVNDGSKDNTLKIMQKLYEKDDKVSYIDLSRNFGKEIAMIAGIDYIDSDAMLIMDADLQDPPEILPQMIEWWEKGYGDVCAKRVSRLGESLVKKWSSYLYYRILQKFSDIDVQIDVGDFRLLDRKCIEALKLMRESQRYTKGMFSWIGFDKKEIFFEREARVAGKTKWNYWKLTNLAIEGITSFTIAPLRFATFIGCILAFLSICYMISIIAKTLIYGGDVAGYPSLISAVLFIGGIQLFFLGIIGEYLGRVFNESKGRPLYFIKDYSGIRKLKMKGD